jgi:hypothetical protein
MGVALILLVRFQDIGTVVRQPLPQRGKISGGAGGFMVDVARIATAWTVNSGLIFDPAISTRRRLPPWRITGAQAMASRSALGLHHSFFPDSLAISVV